MKIIKNISTYLLALIFLVFGSNYFLQFLKMPPMLGNAGIFIGLIYTTKFLLVIKLVEIISAILLFIPKTKALGLLLITPISIGIFLFEILIEQQLSIGILLVLLNAISIFQLRKNYMGIIETIQ